MASAILAGGNEPHWGERKVYMRKIPNPNPNPNPNPIRSGALVPNHTPIAGGHAAHQLDQLCPEGPESVPAACVEVSDDSSAFNYKPAGVRHQPDGGGAVVSVGRGGYVTFHVSTYSRSDLRELKRRLVSELEQVRGFLSWIGSQELPSAARSAGFSASGVYGGGREPKPKRLAAAPESEKLLPAMMKKCGQILMKLMRHKKSIWFNSPVDVVGMGLHDYFQIVKHPMDLGTVKSKLSKGIYQLPMEFAADVRLTFNNALLYNPKGHEVHKLADQLLRLFEGLFSPAHERYKKQLNALAREDKERQMALPWSGVPGVPLVERAVGPERVPVSPVSMAPAPPPPPPPPPAPSLPTLLEPPVLTVVQAAFGKQRKPKAKDPNKRPMSYLEKQKLSYGLQNLPLEKMDQMLQILRKRNLDPTQHGDEIELDLDTMDTETLWELDRFLSNCKKMMSKIKRQEAMAGISMNAGAPATAPALAAAEVSNRSPQVDAQPETVAAARCKKSDPHQEEEDVDIGDEMPNANYPPVEIERDGCGYESSSNSSSSSGSSSSTDSDSGSSSGSDSEEDNNPQSPAVGSRSSPRN